MKSVAHAPLGCILKPVDTAAAPASGSTTATPVPQPRARALYLLLGSVPSPFEATRQPSSGPAEAADLRPNPNPNPVLTRLQVFA